MTGKIVKCFDSVSVCCELVSCPRALSVRESICMCSLFVCVCVLVSSVTAATSPLIEFRETHGSVGLCVCVCVMLGYRFSGEKNSGSCGHL